MKWLNALRYILTLILITVATFGNKLVLWAVLFVIFLCIEIIGLELKDLYESPDTTPNPKENE